MNKILRAVALFGIVLQIASMYPMSGAWAVLVDAIFESTETPMTLVNQGCATFVLLALVSAWIYYSLRFKKAVYKGTVFNGEPFLMFTTFFGALVATGYMVFYSPVVIPDELQVWPMTAGVLSAIVFSIDAKLCYYSPSSTQSTPRSIAQ